MIDDHNREVLAIEVDFSLPSIRVLRVLDQIAAVHGYPMQIRMDNVPEFISELVADWAKRATLSLLIFSDEFRELVR